MAASNKKKETSKKNTTPNDWEKEGLKGEVVQLQQSFYEANVTRKGVVKCTLKNRKYSFKNFTFFFNEKGNIIEKHLYQTDNEWQKKICNNDGNTIESCTYKDGNLKSSSLFKYNEQGKLTEHLNTYDGKKSTTVWVYDKNNALIEYYSVNEENKTTSKQTFVNDENGHKIEQYIYDADGNIERSLFYKNNKWGHIIETNEFDKNNNLTKSEKTKAVYDENGKLISFDGQPYIDRKANETFEFEYDQQGNWIRKIEFYNAIPIGVYFREITYKGQAVKEINEKPKENINLWLVNVTHALEEKEEKKKRDYYELESDGYYWEEDEEEAKKNRKDSPLTPEQLKWVGTGTKTGELDAYRYYICINNDIPSENTFLNEETEVFLLLKYLIREEDAEVIYMDKDTDESGYNTISDYTLSFPDKGYLLVVNNINEEETDQYDIPESMERQLNNDRLNQGTINLLMPSHASGKRNKVFEDSLQYYIELCTFKTFPEKPFIYMIQVSGSSYSLKQHAAEDNFVIKDLNINYGYGFDKFHNDLMNRFKEQSKGLVLFHGEPGTGKTYYIRHLLRTMATNKKIVIYMPPNMVDYLVEPTFMTFISQQVNHFSQQGKCCALLIEDAEPLLAKRQEGVRIQGVTNLLNMTDGLLNDMLNLQIICTFNVDLKKLDKALLRPGRLLARKEFKALSVLDANLLASRLGIKHHFNKPATLGEIYSMLENQNTLIHDVEQDKGASNIIDDL